MDKNGTQDSKDDEITKILGNLDPDQKMNLDNYIKEIIKSEEFENFVKEKQTSESSQDPNSIGNLGKFIYEELPVLYEEYQSTNSKFDVEQPDRSQIEDHYRTFNERLLEYFGKLTDAGIDKIKELTPEELFVLKQFLKDKYLRPTDMHKILKETDFKAAPNKTDKKIKKLYSLHYVERDKQSHSTGYVSGLGRGTYYKLTSLGLFFAVKEIQDEYIGDPIIQTNLENRIFEVYKEDPLLQLFLHDLIDKNLLSEITDYHIKRLFVNYLKQVCKEIYKELEFFVNFQKNGIGDGSGLKWNRDLEGHKEDWDRFFDNLLFDIIPVTAIDNKVSNLSELVTNPIISGYSCSFYYNDTKYSIEIKKEGKSERAIFRINDEEGRKVYDKEKGEEEFVKYREIDVQVRPHCRILNRSSREPNDYLLSLTRRFLLPIDLLKTQLGHSVLQLFKENDFVKYDVFQTSDSKNYLTEIRKLALDVKVKRLIDEVHKEVNENYDGFTKLAS